MKKELANSIQLVVLLFFIAFLGFFASKNATITGLVIYEKTINMLNWTFDDADDYSYDDSLINLSNGEAKLARSVVEHIWNVENLTNAYAVSALEYEPGKNTHDRTSKVQSLDSETVNINPDKEIFDVTFDRELNNNDIISMHIKHDDEDNVNVYLCSNGTSCSQPGYGLVNFNGNEGWYNITITGLADSKNIFNIHPSEKIKFDYIKAIHKGTATYSSTNITYPNSASIETKDIPVTFLSSFLTFQKNDLPNNQDINYYYSVDSGNNWHDIPDSNNLSNIGITNQRIRIKAELSSDSLATPIIYDFSVEYETQICNEDWNATYGTCLSNNTKLKYYIDKNDCGTINNLSNDNGTYEACVYVTPCTEDWNLTYGECLVNNTKLKYYIDRNECETANNLPIGNGTHENCDYCSPDWTCIEHGICQLSNSKKCIAVEDNNLCYNLTNLSSDFYSGNYDEFELSCIYNKTGAGFSNLSISATANEKLVIDKANSTDAILELNSSDNLEDIFVSIMKYFDNKKNSSPSLRALNKYLDIEANNSLKASINSIKIRIYYTDEEISAANLNEETLKIHYFNETSNQWQVLNSIVNTSGNYVDVTIDHLSTFGIFGEEKVSVPQESSGSSSSSSNGGGGSRRKTTTAAIKPIGTEVKTETPFEKEETVKEEKIEKIETPEEAGLCNYKISVSIPEHVSLVESEYIQGRINNIGNCRIENLNIAVSAELKDLISIANKNIGNIEINGSTEFLLFKKLGTDKASGLLIQGFNINIPEDNLKTYNGSLIVGAVIQEQLAFEEKIGIRVDLIEPPSVRDMISSKIYTLLFIFLLFIVASFVIYQNFFKQRVEN